MNWDDPAARGELIERVGIDEYNRQMKAHQDALPEIYPVSTGKFGTVYAVKDTDRAFYTRKDAEAFLRERSAEKTSGENEMPKTKTATKKPATVKAAPAPKAQKAPKAPKAAAAPKAPKKAAKKTATVAETTAKEPREGSKKALVIGMIERASGAGRKELAKATGWDEKFVHGFVAWTVKKHLAKSGRSLEATKNKETGDWNYKVAA